MYRLSKKREAQLLRQINYQIKNDVTGYRDWGHWQVQIKKREDICNNTIYTVRIGFTDDLYISDVILEGHTTHLTPQYVLGLIKRYPRI